MEKAKTPIQENAGELDQFRSDSRRNLLRSIAIFCIHNGPLDGYYMEFGCHKARTMRLAWDVCHHEHNWTYVAFDSFEGLPEIQEIDKMPIWQKGSCTTSEEEFLQTALQHGIPRERLITIKGFYEQSLTTQLRDRLLPKKAVVVYIDCDLYASAVPVLNFIKDFLQRGTIIVFDDWFCFFGDPERGERRAFREFCHRNPQLIFEEFAQTSETKSFIYLGAAGNGSQL